MRGFAALARKELLEQRRTWKLAAMTGIFIAVAALTIVIPLIISVVRGEPRTADDARQVIEIFVATIVTLGSLVAIIAAMGLLANERASGTAGLTLVKPVTRTAFVAVKHIGLILSVFVALFLASAIAYLVALFFFGNPGFPQYVLYMATMGIWLAFTGSVTLFFSGMFQRQVLAAGVGLLIYVAQLPLSIIPHTERYWPVNVSAWGGSFFSDSDAGNLWPTLPITLAAIVALGIGTWVVFHRKEL